MAVGTEVAHPVNILDGVSKVPVAVSSKEMMAAITSCSVTESHSTSLSSIAEVRSEETQSVTSPSTSEEKVSCPI
jgi:hypothetical protein